MKQFVLLFSLLCFVGITAAEDKLVVRYVSPPLLKAIKQPLPTTITGSEFKKIEDRVRAVIHLLDNQNTWTDMGPDASYASAEIDYGKKHYAINSWFPLFRDKPTVAVLERRGLVAVSGAAEKKRLEAGNSQKYQTIVGIFELVKIPKPNLTPKVAPRIK